MTKGLHKNSIQKVDNPHQWMIDDARMALIQQIKAEVERLKKNVDNSPLATEQIAGYLLALADMQKALSTLQEQPVENKEEFSDFESALFSAFSDMWQSYMRGEEVNVAEHVRRVSSELLKVALKQNDQPVCEGLEEEIERYFNDMYSDVTPHERASDSQNEDASKEIARHFAQWQKEKDGKQWEEDGTIFIPLSVHKEVKKLHYEQGKRDMKEQMLKEAVEGTVIVPIYDGDDTWSAEVTIPGRYEIGDKVRIIIVKED